MNEKNRLIIDSHAHIGIQDHSFDQSFESYLFIVRGTGISKVAAFPPVAEIYDRYDFNFRDNDQWIARRTRANNYLLSAGNEELEVIPYFFIWNDFAVEQISPWHKGIKWHRHSNEPTYHYETEKCAEAIDFITQKNMPVVLEEELSNTIRFINEIAPQIRVIIPHLGGLNGGYRAIANKGLWENPNVWADTALASPGEITHYIENYGHERLLFGSDFPFGDPGRELEKIIRLGLPEEVENQILSGNLIRLLAGSNCS